VTHIILKLTVEKQNEKDEEKVISTKEDNFF